MVTTDFPLAALGEGNALSESTEVASKCRAAELVVERAGTKRALDHDVERGCDVRRATEVSLPGLLVARDKEVGDSEACQTGFGLGAAPNGAFITNLAAGASRSTGIRRDSGRMVVSLNLHENGHVFLLGMIEMPYPRIRLARRVVRHCEAWCTVALEYGSVIRVSGDCPGAVQLLRVAYHLEQ